MNPYIVYSKFAGHQPETVCRWQVGNERPGDLPLELHELGDAFENVCADPLIKNLVAPVAGSTKDAYRCNVGIIAAVRALLTGPQFGSVRVHADYSVMSSTDDGWKPDAAGVQFPVTLVAETPTSAKQFIGIQP